MYTKKPDNIFYYLKRITAGVGASYLNTIVYAVSVAVTVPLYLFFLGKEEYGIWLTILGVVSYLGLSNLGIGETVINMVTDAHAKNDVRRISSIVSTAFFAYIRIVLVLIVIILAASVFLPLHFLIKVSPDKITVLRAVFFVSASSFLLRIPLKLTCLTLRALNLIYKEQFLNSMYIMLRVGFITAALLSGLKLVGVVLVTVFIDCLYPMLLLIVIKKEMPSFVLSPKIYSKTMFREMWHPSVYFIILQISGTLIWTSPTLIIAYKLGAAAVVPYAIAFKLVTTISSLTSTAMANIRPAITNFFARGQWQALRKLYLNSLRFSFSLGTLMALGLWFRGSDLISLWAGSNQYVGNSAFGLITATMFIQFILYPSDVLLISTTKHRGYAICAFLEGCLNLSLSIILISHFGILGVAAAVFISRVLTTGWYIVFKSKKVLNLRLIELLAVSFKPVLIPAVVMLGTLHFLAFGNLDNYIVGLLTGAVAGVIFLLFYYKFSINKEQKTLLINIIISFMNKGNV